MKLTDIISISGKPGLYELLNRNKSPFTAKDLETGRKLPIFPRDNIVSLADISIYTDSDEDIPLGEVFEKIKEKHVDGIQETKDILSSSDALHNFMNDILPSYDKDRVRDGDIKKVIKWFNLLTHAGMDSFIPPVNESHEESECSSEEK